MEEQKFTREFFNASFAELGKLIQEVSELKAKANNEEVRRVKFPPPDDFSIIFSLFFLDKEENRRKTHWGIIDNRKTEETEPTG